MRKIILLLLCLTFLISCTTNPKYSSIVKSWDSTKPLIIDAENDISIDSPENNLKALYFSRNDDLYFFRIEFYENYTKEDLVTRILIDMNMDGQFDSADRQIDINQNGVKVQTLADPFIGYMSVSSEVAFQEHSIEFYVSMKEFGEIQTAEISGGVFSSAMSPIDRFDKSGIVSGNQERITLDKAFVSDSDIISETEPNYGTFIIELPKSDERSQAAHFVPVQLPQNQINQVIQLNSKVFKILPHPDQGFNYDFYLYIPDSFNIETSRRLLVISIASGGEQGRSAEYYSQWARDVVINGNWETVIAEELQTPLIYPAFERPENSSHASLTREAMLVSGKRFSRLDSQMLSMISFANQYIKNNFLIEMEEKVLMAGYSMSGSFTSRFVIMYPETVQAAAYGGISSVPILPYTKHDSTQTNLFYPVGISDFQRISGLDFNMESYTKVPIFYFEGAEDPQDISQYGGLFPQELQKWMYSTMGKEMTLRWKSYTQLLDNSGLMITFKRYPDLGHDINIPDIVDFLKVHL